MASSASSVSAHTSRISMRLPLHRKKRSAVADGAEADAEADGVAASEPSVADMAAAAIAAAEATGAMGAMGGCLGVPLDGELVVLSDAFAMRVADAEIVLGLGETLRRRLSVQLSGKLEVLRDALAALVAVADVGIDFY